MSTGEASNDDAKEELDPNNKLTININDDKVLYGQKDSFYDHPIFNTDSYKVSMSKQYPPGTKYVYSYIEARKNGKYTHTLYFGLQAYIKKYLTNVLTRDQHDAAKKIWGEHGYTLPAAWEKLIGEPLPIKIYSIPEGSVVPITLPLVAIENTNPDFYWLTTWIETSILRAIWYPTTVATQSKSMKNVIKSFYSKNNINPNIDFKLHDFGARGVSSYESSGLGGAAHLINFSGTDNMAGAITACKYYNTTIGNDFWATSIPATEHSTMTSWGRGDEEIGLGKETIEKLEKKMNITNLSTKKGEEAAYINQIVQYDTRVVAVVSDSYDIYKAVYSYWGGSLKELVKKRYDLAKDTPGFHEVVIRPDSGDPLTICSRLIIILGLQNNDKTDYKDENNYRLLKYFRLIQGDGVNEKSVTSILSAFTTGINFDNVKVKEGDKELDNNNKRFSPVLLGLFGTEDYESKFTDDDLTIYNECFDKRKKVEDMCNSVKWHPNNINFGMGGALLQILNRDTQKWAMKCSSITLDGDKVIKVVKDPITDQGKKSKSGRVAPFKTTNGGYGYKTFDDIKKGDGNLFQKVFEDGKLIVEQKFKEIINRSNEDESGALDKTFDVDVLKNSVTDKDKIYVKIEEITTGAGGNRSKKRRYRKSKKARKTRKSHRKSKKGRGRR